MAVDKDIARKILLNRFAQELYKPSKPPVLMDELRGTYVAKLGIATLPVSQHDMIVNALALAIQYVESQLSKHDPESALPGLIDNCITADLAPLFKQHQQTKKIATAATKKSNAIKVEKKWDKLLKGIAEHRDEITVVAGGVALGVLFWGAAKAIPEIVKGLGSGIRP